MPKIEVVIGGGREMSGRKVKSKQDPRGKKVRQKKFPVFG